MNRYVEAMARASFEMANISAWEDSPNDADDDRRLYELDRARAILTAILAELRADSIATDLLAAGNISYTGADLLARLCDYLAGDA